MIRKPTEFGLGKAAISAGTHAVMNKWRVDVFDVMADAALIVGASSLLAGAIDVYLWDNVQPIKIFGMNKSMSEFGIDFSTGYISGKIGEKALNSLKPHLQNKGEKNLLNTVISIPSSVFGKGIEKAVKNDKYEQANHK